MVRVSRRPFQHPLLLVFNKAGNPEAFHTGRPHKVCLKFLRENSTPEDSLKNYLDSSLKTICKSMIYIFYCATQKGVMAEVTSTQLWVIGVKFLPSFLMVLF